MGKKKENSELLALKDNVITIYQDLHSRNTSDLVEATDDLMYTITSEEVYLDLAKITHIDSVASTALFVFREKLEKKNIKLKFINASANVDSNLKLFEFYKEIEDNSSEKKGFFEIVGENLYNFVAITLKNFLILTADIFYWTFTDAFSSKHHKKGEVKNQATLIGANAVLIVTVMTFIIGFVLAVQSASQLRNFGADIFIVDLTVISIMSEMGPLIAAILVAGRSGSAIAAEIATMKVTSELEALQTMSLNPIRFVIVPKIYAGIITMPFLVMMSNVAGIFGGMLAAYIYLGITPEVFFNRISEAFRNIDLITGLIKSIVFIIVIIITGSYYGLQVERGAAGVGIMTTKAVVVSIALVIITDSLIGLLFY